MQSINFNKSRVRMMMSYHNHVETQVGNYISDPFIPYVSVIGSIFLCKMIYDCTQLFSSFFFKSYAGLSTIQRIEWNNRGISTVHAIFMTVMSTYLVFLSDLYCDDHLGGPITFRSSALSNFTLGVSVGYFIADLVMILWLYPSLGGLEYVLHHLLSMFSVAYSMLFGEGQIHTYMVLISEITTPTINLRWYLDVAGMKSSAAYLINGIVIFLAWLAEKMHTFGHLFVFVVPSVLLAMNLMWFMKILKGLKKTLAKRH